MKTVKYILTVACLILAVSCRKEPASDALDQASAIWLKAGVVPASVQTRTPYTQAMPTFEQPLDAAVWASSTEYAYSDLDKDGSAEAGYVVAKHTSASFQSGDSPQLLSDAVYPKDEGSSSQPLVYFIGLYPITGWSSTDSNAGTDAIRTFDGKTDLLFAPEITGYYGIPFADSPVYNFYHLLTWLKIELCAYGADVLERETVCNAWGKITNLKLKDQKSALAIDLTAPNPDVSSSDPAVRTANVATKVSFTGATAPMPFYATGTDDVFPDASGYDIPTVASMTDVAYVLCAPVEATVSEYDPISMSDVRTTEYTLTVTTEHRSPIDIPIDLKTAADTWFAGTTVGKQFTISLTFKIGNTIAVSTSVTDWSTGGIGTAHITE